MKTRRQKRKSWVLVLITKRLTSNYSQKITSVWKIRIQGCEWSTPWITKNGRSQIRRLRGVDSLWPICPSFRLAHCPTDRVPLGPWFLQWRKESLRLIPSLSSIPLGMLTCIPLHTEHWGELAELHKMGSTRNKDEGKNSQQPVQWSCCSTAFLIARVLERVERETEDRKST